MLYPYIQEAGLLWMSPIIFLSFIGFAIILERISYWFSTLEKTKGRKQKLSQIYSEPFSLSRVTKVCSNTQDHLLLIISEFITNYNKMSLDLAEKKTELFAGKKIDQSREFLDILSLISNIAGTLGLMGTVVGISQSFKTLANEDPKGLASSLSTAMYTTIGGIILFLMSYLCLFFLEKIANKFEDEVDEHLQQIKQYLCEKEKSQSIIFSENEPKKDKISMSENQIHEEDTISIEPKNEEKKIYEKEA